MALFWSVIKDVPRPWRDFATWGFHGGVALALALIFATFGAEWYGVWFAFGGYAFLEFNSTVQLSKNYGWFDWVDSFMDIATPFLVGCLVAAQF